MKNAKKSHTPDLNSLDFPVIVNLVGHTVKGTTFLYGVRFRPHGYLHYVTFNGADWYKVEEPKFFYNRRDGKTYGYLTVTGTNYPIARWDTTQADWI